MTLQLVEALGQQLIGRQQALVTTISEVGPQRDLVRLLVQVDQALERLATDAFGRCAACGGKMTDDEMREQPMSLYCLCDLSDEQQRALQRDLDLAWRIQASLLPDQDLSHASWKSHYRYQPAGPVSGDYCDAIIQETEGGWLYFLVGDVSGKGVAASYLMAHLSALVRRTLDEPVPVAELMSTLNRHLTERSPETHFITLVCGRAHRSGRVEICNAGHCLPLLVRGSCVEALDSTGLPLGIVEESAYQALRFDMESNDSLVLYTDGITEAHNLQQEMYGRDSLSRILGECHTASPAVIANECLRDLNSFREGASITDDLTLMILQRELS